MSTLQFTTSYLLHIGVGNFSSVELFAYMHNIELTKKQLKKYVRAAYKQSKKNKTLVMELNNHLL